MSADFRAPKSLRVINACLDEMEEFKGRHAAIGWLTVFFFFLVTKPSKNFLLPNSSLSLECFHVMSGRPCWCP